jgi:hypothetical protein
VSACCVISASECQRVNRSGAIPARFNWKTQTDLKEYREGPNRLATVLSSQTLLPQQALTKTWVWINCILPNAGKTNPRV